jgi:hypothetical protein
MGSSSETLKNCVETVAILLGGGWAFWNFWLRRQKETALDIDMTHRCLPYGQGLFLTHFDVVLANRGSVKLVAKRDRVPAYAAHGDGETLKYSGDLLLRPIPSDMAVGSKVAWFCVPSDASPQPGDLEVDLLADHETDGKTHFWMEPGETYHLGVGLVLQPGTYLVLATFVGNASDDEFWRRLFMVNVPEHVASDELVEARA